MLGRIGRRLCGGRCFCCFYWQGSLRRCPELITCLISWIEKLFHLSHCEANRTKKRSRNSVLAGISSLSLSLSRLYTTHGQRSQSCDPNKKCHFKAKRKPFIHMHAMHRPSHFFGFPTLCRNLKSSRNAVDSRSRKNLERSRHILGLCNTVIVSKGVEQLIKSSIF